MKHSGSMDAVFATTEIILVDIGFKSNWCLMDITILVKHMLIPMINTRLLSAISQDRFLVYR